VGVGDGVGSVGGDGGWGDGVGSGDASSFGADPDEAVPCVLVGFDALAGSVASAEGGDSGRIASSRGERVVGTGGVPVRGRATGSTATRSTAALKPPSGTDGAGVARVAMTPRRTPNASPTATPTIDWIDFESTSSASQVIPGDRTRLRPSLPDRTSAGMPGAAKPRLTDPYGD
jgi:hypothetical protein